MALLAHAGQRLRSRRLCSQFMTPVLTAHDVRAYVCVCRDKALDTVASMLGAVDEQLRQLLATEPKDMSLRLALEQRLQSATMDSRQTLATALAYRRRSQARAEAAEADARVFVARVLESRVRVAREETVAERRAEAARLKAATEAELAELKKQLEAKCGMVSPARLMLWTSSPVQRGSSTAPVALPYACVRVHVVLQVEDMLMESVRSQLVGVIETAEKHADELRARRLQLEQEVAALGGEADRDSQGTVDRDLRGHVLDLTELLDDQLLPTLLRDIVTRVLPLLPKASRTAVLGEVRNLLAQETVRYGKASPRSSPPTKTPGGGKTRAGGGTLTHSRSAGVGSRPPPSPDRSRTLQEPRMVNRSMAPTHPSVSLLSFYKSPLAAPPAATATPPGNATPPRLPTTSPVMMPSKSPAVGKSGGGGSRASPRDSPRPEPLSLTAVAARQKQGKLGRSR